MHPHHNDWRCPVCRNPLHDVAFLPRASASENLVDSERFRPATTAFGAPVGTVVRCRACGHGSVIDLPPADDVAIAYLDAADPGSLAEEAGQVATADRDLAAVEAALGPGWDRPTPRLLDVGCWTGSFLVAAEARGWDAYGIEPSSWAAQQAKERGLEVRQGSIERDGFDAGTFRVVVACDVLEHLAAPAPALARMVELLEPGGVLFATVPDAGSRVARLLGRHWWAVLPMHLQYFTRPSLSWLLAGAGLEVRSIGTHPKAFSRRYYAERVAAFVPVAGPVLAAAVGRTKRADDLVAPDLRDRVAVIAGAPRAAR